MCPSIPKKTNTAPPSIGASTAQTASCQWHLIDSPLSFRHSAEESLVDNLTLLGYAVDKAGSRYERFDLTVVHDDWVRDDKRIPGLIQRYGDRPRRYEVKKLYRKTRTSSIDRRVKVGSRGETIYGRYDALIKAFALDVENYLEHNWTAGVEGTQAVIEIIDAALERRHGKDFMRKIQLLAEAYDDVHALSSASALLEHGGIQAEDILRGFSDIDGIFVMVSGAAGDYFMLVSREEIPRMFAFDSVSVEGVKLRFLGAGPIET